MVIVGAGFGGIDCARELVNKPIQVTLIDRHNFHTFQPLLYQVATSGLSSSDVAYPVRGIFHDAANVRFRTGELGAVEIASPVLPWAGAASGIVRNWPRDHRRIGLAVELDKELGVSRRANRPPRQNDVVDGADTATVSPRGIP